MDEVLLTTVTPVYQGADSLVELVEALVRVREQLEAQDLPLRLVESIFVDDGSSDGSGRVLAELAETYDWLHVVTLSRNFGQHPATSAGILHSSGDWVTTLDEDLQHPPSELLRLLARTLATNSDVAYAQPLGGVHGSVFRDASSRWVKRIIAKLSGDDHVAEFNSFRMMRGSVARAAAAVSTHDMYFDVALGWFTNRITTLSMDLRDPRPTAARGSGYGLRSLISHGRRMLMSSDIKALRVGATIGVTATLTSLVAGTIALGLWIVRPEDFVAVRGWLSLFLSILFFGGMTALLAGIAVEYLSMLLRLAQGKPTFFVVDRSKDPLLDPLVEQIGAP
jgi:glycosyltransferase involved in cell wall biosynthesis